MNTWVRNTVSICWADVWEKRKKNCTCHLERHAGIRPVGGLKRNVGPEGGGCVSREGKKKCKTREERKREDIKE
jgi:hypothetical protein